MTPSTPHPTPCPRCLRVFACHRHACWCADLHLPAHLLQALRTAYTNCLCPDCLHLLATAADHAPSLPHASLDPLLSRLHQLACSAKHDSYTDPGTGYTVFTARFLLNRGYCCGSGCRHCPFGNSP